MLTRCPKHGRVYDKNTERCPLCIPGAPAPGSSDEDRKAKRRGTITNVVAVVVLLVGGFTGWWLFIRQPPPPPPPAPVVIDTMALLDEGETYADSTDRTPIRQARVYAAALERVYADRGALLRFGEGPADTGATDRAARTRARAYVTFRTRWDARLTGAKPENQKFYRPGVRWAESLERVNNYLGAARSVMRQAAPADQVVARRERETAFSAARGYLNSARTLLTEMPGDGSTSRPAARRRPARRR